MYINAETSNLGDHFLLPRSMESTSTNYINTENLLKLDFKLFKLLESLNYN